MGKSLLFDEYNKILENEAKLSGSTAIHAIDPQEILGLVTQIQSVVESSTVPRCCVTRYILSHDKIVYESTSAHTNLVQMIVDRVLAYEYGPYFDKTIDGFTYREIMETIRRHDLPENYTGDIPDDGARNEEEKNMVEQSYLRLFAKGSPSREADFEEKVCMLQLDMTHKIGFCGELLYLADKISAVFTTLGYDEKGISPMLSNHAENLSEKDRLAMSICEDKTIYESRVGDGVFCKASEMWTIDYFRTRELYKYDSTGLITALLVMYTLVVRGKWYEWREEDYKKIT